MISKVAIVKTIEGHQKALERALSLIGGIDDLNARNRDVVVKIGIYDARGLQYPTLEATKAVVNAFNHAHHVFLVESDNHIDKALNRLQMWKEAFTKRVLPFSLTEDKNVKEVSIIGEKVNLSQVLFKPNVRVSFHAFKGAGGPDWVQGTILKNLLGIIPDTKKERFHDKLGVALVDMMEAIGGLDLAIIDATYTYYGKFEEGKPSDRLKTNLLVIGRDAVAVEAVGCALVDRNPLDTPSLAEAAKRGFGPIDLNKIEILGEPLENVKIKIPRQS